MARISEIVVAIEAEGTEKVLAALNQVEGAQVKTVKTTKQLGAQTKEATATAGEGWATLVTGVNQAIGVLQTVVQVGKAVYDFTKQGAQLEFMAGKFDRLSLSIGTTSDVLLDDLRRATQGTRSDMELMASASDFMALGFAKTSDEAVRLSTVAGALNMNMNQLVLTLANQTTMRFDQLGVSVVGFQEKVDALVKSGMSANAAFQEAFLRQAEEQIQKVGNAADSAVGSFMQLEASFTNFSNALKVGTSNAISPAVKELSKLLQLYAGRMQGNQAFNDLADQLERAGVAADDFNQKFADTKNLAGWIVEVDDYNALLAEMRASLDQATAGETEWNDKMLDSLVTLQQIPAAADGAGQAVERFAVSSESAAYAVDNFLEKAGIFKADFEEIFDLSKNLNKMVSFASSYNGLMDQIAAKTAEKAKLMAQGWTENSKNVKELTADIAALEAELGNLPKQMTFDLFTQAIQANGKVTREEYQALMDMGVELGIFTQEAADASMKAWDKVMKNVNDWEIDPKTGDVTLKLNTEEVDDYQPETKKGLVEWLIDQTRVDAWQPPDKVGRVTYNVTNVPGTVWEETRAIGGPVYPNNTYLWQEPNREGELFVPEQYGRVMNNHQVAQAIRDAMFASNAGGGRTGGAVTTDNSRHITYSINAQYKQEPVLTLSQHLKILSTLGGRA